MINWIKKLFTQTYEPLNFSNLELGKTLREQGQDYAYDYLQNGGNYEDLELYACNVVDPNDFDRGSLDVCRKRDKGE